MSTPRTWISLCLHECSTFASQPHRARTRVVLAELGSLSVEFTRLAQITKEAKYYDAVARITNEFDIWQNNTKLPGLWPQQVDASGCKKPDVTIQPVYDHTISTVDNEIQSPTLMEGVPAKEAHAAKNSTTTIQADKRSPPTSSDKRGIRKRQVDAETGTDSTPKPPDCEPQGLSSPPFAVSEDFGIGGQADSTYEYLPKEYMLLGGLEDKYRSMYETFVETSTKNLLFRPMIRDEKRHILQAGNARVDNRNAPVRLTPEGTHLTCFVGGMYAVGAKIFGRHNDLDLAKKLTDGCVWAYESTTTGIMPESYLVIPCPDQGDCPWNETLYHETLDPYSHVREQQRLQQQQTILENEKRLALQESEEKVAQANSTKNSSVAGTVQSQPEGSDTVADDTQTSQKKADEAVGKSVEDPVAELEQYKAAMAVSKPREGMSIKSDSEVSEEDAEMSSLKPVEGATPPKPLEKRQLGEVGEVQESAFAGDIAAPAKEAAVAPVAGTATERVTGTEPVVEKSTAEQHVEILEDHGLLPKTTNRTFQSGVYTPPPIPTREEFVRAKIRDERLPDGMTRVTGPRYLLR